MKQLAQAISTRLPQLDITDLLIKVDGWTGFSDAFKHLGGSSHRDNRLVLHLYGCLLAQACNLELKQLATSAELSYPHLSWCNTWYIREDTLREANDALVNYHYRQPLSQLWGGGMLSSSDGQQFPVKRSVRQGRAVPRYFGYFADYSKIASVPTQTSLDAGIARVWQVDQDHSYSALVRR